MTLCHKPINLLSRSLRKCRAMLWIVKLCNCATMNGSAPKRPDCQGTWVLKGVFKVLTEELPHAVSQVVLLIEGIVARGVLDIHIQSQYTPDLQSTRSIASTTRHLHSSPLPTTSQTCLHMNMDQNLIVQRTKYKRESKHSMCRQLTPDCILHSLGRQCDGTSLSMTLIDGARI